MMLLLLLGIFMAWTLGPEVAMFVVIGLGLIYVVLSNQ